MGDFLYLLNLWILLFLQIGIGKFLIYNDSLRHNSISCTYVYENQRRSGKWHSFPGLQMVSNCLVHGSLAWLKKIRAQLKLQQKNAFQSDHIFNQATELCYALICIIDLNNACKIPRLGLPVWLKHFICTRPVLELPV
jgi:hypothetical protein